jgi:hypothetical protein
MAIYSPQEHDGSRNKLLVQDSDRRSDEIQRGICRPIIWLVTALWAQYAPVVATEYHVTHTTAHIAPATA